MKNIFLFHYTAETELSLYVALYFGTRFVPQDISSKYMPELWSEMAVNGTRRQEQNFNRLKIYGLNRFRMVQSSTYIIKIHFPASTFYASPTLLYLLVTKCPWLQGFHVHERLLFIYFNKLHGSIRDNKAVTCRTCQVYTYWL